ncbi:MAG: TrbG/VirB9 family P-type conjugative transfer protein [Rhizorhabdus sp.]|uniref:TrbG/VirB9 family P-type conjugative transfer protein n=1 Tax=Rhizorhabdus sp. TaxID=1968843 RepID=UPI001B5DE191|nr:TrbG/VirB9 family P-type conjugative transfer protein [Rhizorhabdus sp.]MBP8231116.1 TrbG/VirB9 family P-type conjugative transfer protein [Rhizorhabdus sp.]
MRCGNSARRLAAAVLAAAFALVGLDAGTGRAQPLPPDFGGPRSPGAAPITGVAPAGGGQPARATPPAAAPGTAAAPPPGSVLNDLQGSPRRLDRTGAQAAPIALPGGADPRAGATQPAQLRDDPTASLDMIQRAWATPVAAPGQVGPGVKRVGYERDAPIKIRARRYMTTTVMLPGCERIDDVVVGDSNAFRVAQPWSNRVTVAPEYVGVDSNMTIVTASGTVYDFYLLSVDFQDAQLPDLRVEVEAPGVCRGGAGGSRRSGAEAAADFARRVPTDPSRYRWDGFSIWVRDDASREIAPDRVFSDGVWTMLDFGERGDRISIPAAFLVVDDVDMPVNTRTTGDRGQVLVVEAVGDITLKSGAKVVCIRDARPGVASRAAVVDTDLGRGTPRFAP